MIWQLIERKFEPSRSDARRSRRDRCRMTSSQVQRLPPKRVSPDIPVVAIGASAGGLEALTAILRALPTDIAMAFMLIQHLDPKRHSILPELLSKATKIPVLEAIDAMRIESNRVYVMPSNVDTPHNPHSGGRLQSTSLRYRAFHHRYQAGSRCRLEASAYNRSPGCCESRTRGAGSQGALVSAADKTLQNTR